MNVVPARHLKSLLAILFIASIAGASFFVSNRLSSTAGITPNAPSSKPFARDIDTGELLNSKGQTALKPAEKPAPAAEPPSGGGGGGGGRGRGDDEEVESIVNVAATPVPTKTPKPSKTPPAPSPTPTFHSAPPINRASPSPSPSPTPTPQPTPEFGRYGYKYDDGKIAGTYPCNREGGLCTINDPSTLKEALKYAETAAAATLGLGTAEILKQAGASFVTEYNKCGLKIDCMQTLLTEASSAIMKRDYAAITATGYIDEMSKNLADNQIRGEISNLYISDPKKFKDTFGDTGIFLKLGLKEEEVSKLTTTLNAYKNFYDTSISDTELIKSICNNNSSCISGMTPSFNRGTYYLSSVGGIDTATAQQMGTDLKNNIALGDKINNIAAIYSSNAPLEDVARQICDKGSNINWSKCEADVKRGIIPDIVPQNLRDDLKFARLLATADSPTIIKEFCNGNTACIKEINDTANQTYKDGSTTLRGNPIYEVSRRLADTGLQNIALNNRRDYLMDVMANYEAKARTYKKEIGDYNGSYNGPTYKNSIINDAQQYNIRENKAAFVWAIQNGKIDPKTVIPENPTTEQLKKLGITDAMLEYDKLVRNDPTIVDKHYNTYLTEYKPVFDKKSGSIKSLSLDTGLFNMNNFTESNKVIQSKVINYLENSSIAGLTKDGKILDWKDASEEYKTAARQKACETDKNLAELCKTGLKPPVGRPGSQSEAERLRDQYEASRIALENKISSQSEKYLTLVYDEKFGNAIAGMSTAFSNVASVDNPLTRALYGDLVDKALKEGRSDTSRYVPVGVRGGQTLITGTQDEINRAANDYINRRLVETTYTRGTGIGGAIATAFVAGTTCGIIAGSATFGLAALPAGVVCGVVSGTAAALSNIVPILGEATQTEINAEQKSIKEFIGGDDTWFSQNVVSADTAAGFIQSAYSNQGAASYTADGYMLGGAVTRKDNNFALYNSINLTSAQQGTSLLNPFQDPNAGTTYLANIQINRDFDKLAMTQNNLAIANLVVSAVTGGASGGIGVAIADDIIPPATLAKILASKFISNPQTVAVNVANSALNLAQATLETESTIDDIDTQPEIDLQKCLIAKGYENCTEEQKYVEETNTQIAKDDLAASFWFDTFMNIGQETFAGATEYHRLNNPPPFAAISANPADIPNSSRAYTRVELEQRALALGIEDPSRSNFGNKDALLANILKSEREIAKQFGVTPEQIRATPDQNVSAYASSHKNLSDKNIIISQVYGNGIVEFRNTETGDVRIAQKNAPDALIISNAKKQGVDVEGQSFREVLADTKNRKALEPPPASNEKQKIGALFPTGTTDTELDNRANAIGLDTSNAKNRTEKWQMIIKREAEISKITGLPVDNIRALSNKDVNYYYDSVENLSNPRLVISSIDEETGFVKFKNVDKGEEFSVHPTSPEARKINAAISYGVEVTGKNYISIAGELADISRLPQKPPTLGQPEKINTTTRLSREELNNRAIALGIDGAATNKRYSTKEALWEKIGDTEKQIADTLGIDPEVVRGTSNKNVKYYALSSERISKGDIRMIGFTDEGNVIFENIFDGNRYVAHKDSPESNVVHQALEAGIDPGGLTHVQLKEDLKVAQKENFFYTPSEMSENTRQAEMFGVNPNTLNTKKSGLNSKQLEVIKQSAERINDKNLRVAGIDKSTNRVSYVKDILTPEGPKTAIVDSYDGLPDSIIVIEAQKRGISVFGRNIADIRSDLLTEQGFLTRIIRRLRGFDTSPFTKEDIINKADIVTERVRIARLEEEFKQAKYIDSRTGLINRAGTTAQLEAWSGGKNKPVVIEIGLTYLKDVNDISGDHRIGDNLIDTFSRILSKTAKDLMDDGEFSSAILTTQGGKKFNLILKNNNQKLISAFMSRLNTNIELLQTTNPEHFTANSLSFDISRGTWNGKESALDLVVRVGESRSTKSDLIRKMYPAKKNLDLENIQFANNPLADKQMLLDTLGLPDRAKVTPEEYISEAKKIIKKFGLDVELTGDKTPLEIKRLAAEIPKAYIEKYNAFTPLELKKYASTLLSEDIVDGFARGDLPKLDDVIDGIVYGNRQQDMNNLLEIRKLEKGIENAKTRNSLTGLYNQAAGDLSLNMAIESAERTGGSLSIINIDVSGLGNINEVMGLDAGDELLRIAGDIFDTVSRRGTDKVFKPADPNFAIGESPNGAIAVHPHGDEFAIILPGTDENGGNYVISRLKEELAARKAANPNNDILQALNFDAGVAQWRPGEDVFDFTKRAELKMYEDKIARKSTPPTSPSTHRSLFARILNSSPNSNTEKAPTKFKDLDDKIEPPLPPSLGEPTNIPSTSPMLRDPLTRRAQSLGIAKEEIDPLNVSDLWSAVTAREAEIAKNIGVSPESIRGTSKNIEYYVQSHNIINDPDLIVIKVEDGHITLRDKTESGLTREFTVHRTSPEAIIVNNALQDGLSVTGKNLTEIRSEFTRNYRYSNQDLENSSVLGELLGVHYNTINAAKNNMSAEQLVLFNQSIARINDKNITVKSVNSDGSVIYLKNGIETPIQRGNPDTIIVFEANKRGIVTEGRSIYDIQTELNESPDLLTRFARFITRRDNTAFDPRKVVNLSELDPNRILVIAPDNASGQHFASELEKSGFTPTTNNVEIAPRVVNGKKSKDASIQQDLADAIMEGYACGFKKQSIACHTLKEGWLTSALDLVPDNIKNNLEIVSPLDPTLYPKKAPKPIFIGTDVSSGIMTKKGDLLTLAKLGKPELQIKVQELIWRIKAVEGSDFSTAPTNIIDITNKQKATDLANELVADFKKNGFKKIITGCTELPLAFCTPNRYDIEVKDLLGIEFIDPAAMIKPNAATESLSSPIYPEGVNYLKGVVIQDAKGRFLTHEYTWGPVDENGPYVFSQKEAGYIFSNSKKWTNQPISQTEAIYSKSVDGTEQVAVLNNKTFVSSKTTTSVLKPASVPTPPRPSRVKPPKTPTPPAVPSTSRAIPQKAKPGIGSNDPFTYTPPRNDSMLNRISDFIFNRKKIDGYIIQNENGDYMNEYYNRSWGPTTNKGPYVYTLEQVLEINKNFASKKLKPTTITKARYVRYTDSSGRVDIIGIPEPINNLTTVPISKPKSAPVSKPLTPSGFENKIFNSVKSIGVNIGKLYKNRPQSLNFFNIGTDMATARYIREIDYLSNFNEHTVPLSVNVRERAVAAGVKIDKDGNLTQYSEFQQAIQSLINVIFEPGRNGSDETPMLNTRILGYGTTMGVLLRGALSLFSIQPPSGDQTVTTIPASPTPTPTAIISITPTNTPLPLPTITPSTMPTQAMFQMTVPNPQTLSNLQMSEFGSVAKYIGDIIKDCQLNGYKSGGKLQECMCSTLDCSPGSGGAMISKKIGELSSSIEEGGNLLQCTEFVNAIEYFRKNNIGGYFSVTDNCNASSANDLAGTCTSGSLVTTGSYNFCQPSSIEKSGFQSGDILVWKFGKDGHTAICATPVDGKCNVIEANKKESESDPDNGIVDFRDVYTSDNYSGVWRSTACE